MFYLNCALYRPFSGMAWLIIPQAWTLDLPWLHLIFRPWRIFVILNAVPSIIAASTLFLLPESPKFLFTNAKKEEAVEVLRRMFTLNTGRNAKEYPVRLAQLRAGQGK
jgi:hypothetical protein